MVEIKKDSLEDAFNKEPKENKANSTAVNSTPANSNPTPVSKEMEIGYHQGALNTLLNERNELIRLIQQIESIMQAHIKRLEEMGVKIQTSNDKKE